MKIWSPARFLLVCFSCLLESCASADSVYATKQTGTFVSMNGACTVALKTSPQGGYLQLYIGHEKDNFTLIADDVTGIVWVGSSSLVYSSSPVYGKPGVFVVECGAKPLITTLVEPTHIDSAYPNGSDYFELHAINGQQVQFFYGTDVDKVDFSIFRTTKNKRTVALPKTAAR